VRSYHIIHYYCTVVLLKIFTKAEAFCIILQTSISPLKRNFACESLNNEMARVRSTVRVTRLEDETEMTETAPISEMMRRSRLVVQEEIIVEGTSNAEVEQVVAKAESDNGSEDDDSILCLTKPSHVEFGRSTIKVEDLVLMKKLGYFGENDDELVRFVGEETIPEPKEDEVVVFKSFFRAGLRFPLYEMIGEVLKKFEIYLHQLTMNAIIRLSVYILALRSQGKSANAEGFYRVHELHYQTKARAYGLHKNFGCYNFAYRKDIKAPVIGYHSKWPTGWTNEWFYMKANKKKREKPMSMVMSSLRLNFDTTRPLCNMQLGSPC
jgi:hypothetical protein